MGILVMFVGYVMEMYCDCFLENVYYFFDNSEKMLCC